MAYANNTRTMTSDLGLGSWLAAIRVDLAARFARHRLYRTTRDELAALSDRDLADLGLHRAMIDDVAREAARTA